MGRTHRASRSPWQLWAGRDMPGLALAKPPPCPHLQQSSLGHHPCHCQEKETEAGAFGPHDASIPEFLDDGVAANKGAVSPLWESQRITWMANESGLQGGWKMACGPGTEGQGGTPGHW